MLLLVDVNISVDIGLTPGQAIRAKVAGMFQQALTASVQLMQVGSG